MPKAVNYNIEPLDAGTFVKYKNSLWLNLMKDNDTPPAVDNHSYQLIIEAPKEIEHKGVYEEGKNYKHGDIVMFNDNTWFKTSDPAQNIPSEGWKLFAKRGKQGRKGKATIIENDTTEAMQEMYDEIMQLKGEIKRLKDASKN